MGLPTIGLDAGGDEGDAGFLPDRLEQRGQVSQLGGRNLGIVQVDEAEGRGYRRRGLAGERGRSLRSPWTENRTIAEGDAR